MKGIRRYTYSNSNFDGYRVAICVAGEKFVRYFSVRRHGSASKAELAAVEFLEDLRLILGVFPPYFIPGSKGIHLAKNPGGKGSSSSAAWVATWHENGVRKSRKFSVAKHGAREAKRLAMEARTEAMPFSLVPKKLINRTLRAARAFCKNGFLTEKQMKDAFCITDELEGQEL